MGAFTSGAPRTIGNTFPSLAVPALRSRRMNRLAFALVLCTLACSDEPKPQASAGDSGIDAATNTSGSGGTGGTGGRAGTGASGTGGSGTSGRAGSSSIGRDGGRVVDAGAAEDSGSSDGSAPLPSADFETRCAAPGVIVCRGFDSDAELNRI